MLERIDAMAVLEPQFPPRQCVLAVNLRVGETLTLRTDDGSVIVIEMQAKHGYGGRLRVKAPESIRITPPGR